LHRNATLVCNFSVDLSHPFQHASFLHKIGFSKGLLSFFSEVKNDPPTQGYTTLQTPSAPGKIAR
jgi:hypothetical protein